ncbi:endonuclease/exonuclease/phosphatase family protein [Candidatus Daviesbacteria bacterium]|nr:endonuclease/exonuclease/phosphatase family protein [Candidatus Daviesbacteria bacterium]
MKLISLNTWGGKIYKPLLDFIQKHSQDTDIFCFQEVYSTKSDVKQHKAIRANLLNELIKILSNFQFFYSIKMSGFDSTPNPVNFHLTAGKVIFIKNRFKVNTTGDILLYGDREEKSLKQDFSNLAVTLQSVEFTIQGKKFTVVNIHGTAFPGTKLDTTLRLEHSNKIKGFLNSKKGAKIIVGDFNLLPETQSIKILEEDMQNLIKGFNIKRTRSNLSPFYGKTDFQKFADYTFVSPEVNVISFTVPEIDVSDHLPMILEFS